MRTLVAVAAIVIAMGLPANRAEAATVAPSTATPRTPIDSCGIIDPTVTPDVVVTKDLECNLFQRIFPDRHINIDLQGHTVTGLGPQLPPGDIADVDIHNGTLVHQSLEDIRGRMEDLHIVDSTIGLRGSTLTSSTIENTTLIIWGSDAQITHNSIRGGNGVGIDDVFRGIGNYQISFNDISGSSGGAISYGFSFVFGSGAEITGSIAANHIHDNAGPGISFRGAVQNLGLNTIAFNVIDHNGGPGVLVDGPNATSMVATPDGPIKVGANLLIANHGAGVDAQWVAGVPNQIVDLGRNVSLFNQKRCVGVRCALDFTSGHGFGF